MASNNNRGSTRPRAGMSRPVPNANDYFKGYDAAITAPLRQESDSERVGPIPTEIRTNANDVQQKGRNLGGSLTLGDATKYLQKSTKGYVQGFGDQTFTGPPLPVSQASQYAEDPKQTSGFDASVPDIGGANAVNFDRDGGVAAVQTKDLSNNQPITGEEERIVGGSDRPVKGSLAEALADKEGINSYMSKFNSNDKELARRSAFLNAPDTLSGMKAVKAQLDTVTVGGNDYYHNDGEMIKMDSADMRERLAGRITAEDLKNKYVKDITDSKTETPDQAQDPAVLEEDAPATQSTGRKSVPLETVNYYLDNGREDEYLELLDSGQLTGR